MAPLPSKGDTCGSQQRKRRLLIFWEEKSAQRYSGVTAAGSPSVPAAQRLFQRKET